MFAGIVTVSCGHSHPRFVERVKAQIDVIQHTTTIYLHPNFPLMAKRLADKLPTGLDVTYFVNSGSEANDLAVMMARAYTGHDDVVGVRNGYHGGSPSRGRGRTMFWRSSAAWMIATASRLHRASPDRRR